LFSREGGGGGGGRFKQAEIDLKYESLSTALAAVKSGDLALLKQSIPHVVDDMPMVVSLAIVAVENGYLQLVFNCFCEAILGEQGVADSEFTSCLNLRRADAAGLTIFDVLVRMESETADKLMEVLLFSGLDATPDIKPRPHSLVVESVTRSRVLSLLRLSYLKRSFVDIDSTIELVQTLLLDEI